MCKALEEVIVGEMSSYKADGNTWKCRVFE